MSGGIGGGLIRQTGGARTHDEVGVETFGAVVGGVEGPPELDEHHDLLQARGSMRVDRKMRKWRLVVVGWERQRRRADGEEACTAKVPIQAMACGWASPLA